MDMYSKLTAGCGKGLRKGYQKETVRKIVRKSVRNIEHLHITKMA